MKLKDSLEKIRQQYQYEIAKTIIIIRGINQKPEVFDDLNKFIYHQNAMKNLKEKKDSNINLKKTYELNFINIKWDEINFNLLPTAPIEFMRYLYNMAHIYFLTIFEAFNKDYFIELLTAKPYLMKSKNSKENEKQKELTYNEILQFSSVNQLKRYMAERQMDSIFYKNIDEFFGFLQKRINIDIKKFGKLESLRENYYRRNIIVHNGGVVNEKYLKNVKSTLKKGTLIENNFDYLEECNLNIFKYMDFIDIFIKDKFKIK